MTPDQTTARVRLKALGYMQLEDQAGRPIIRMLKRPKQVALFSVVALGDHAIRSRDRLMAMFWPESPTEKARHSLNQTLYQIRQDLGDVIERQGDDLVVDHDAVWCDVVAFQEAVAADLHREAADLYRGDLLEGLYLSDAPDFERWVDGERSRIRRMASGSLWTLAEEMAEAGSLTEASTVARRAAALTPGEEATIHRLMGFLDGIGDRAGAMAAYAEFAAYLEKEYEVEPSPETEDLVRRIREREDVVASVPVRRPSVGEGAAGGPAAGRDRGVQGDGMGAKSYPLARPATAWRLDARRLAAAIIVAAVLLVAGYALWPGRGAAEGASSRRLVVDVSESLELASPELAGLVRRTAGELEGRLRATEGLTVLDAELARAREAPGGGAGTLVRVDGWEDAGVVGTTVRVVDITTGEIFAIQSFEEEEGTAAPLRFVRQQVGSLERSRALGLDAPDDRVLDLLADADRLAAAGRRHGQQGRFQLADEFLNEADSLLRIAEEVSPGWPEPVLRRGWLQRDRYRILGRRTALEPQRAGEIRTQALAAIDRGEALAESALEVDPDSPFAYDLRGSMRFARLGLVDTGDDSLRNATRSDLERAIALLPELSGAWMRLARIHESEGQVGAALRALEMAVAADPFLADDLATRYSLFQNSAQVGDVETASAICEDGRRQHPADRFFMECGLFLMFWTPERADVGAAWEEFHAMDTLPHPAYHQTRGLRLAYVAGVLAHAGLPDSAMSVLRRKRERGMRADSVSADIAEIRVRSLLGDTGGALDLLEERLRRSPRLRALLPDDPSFSRLVGEERFSELASEGVSRPR